MRASAEATMLMRGALCLAACGGFACAPPAAPAEHAAAITQGSPAGADPAVVAIVGPDGTTGCSGSLIGPHAVLTAGHCVPPVGRHELRVFFGDSVAGAGTFIDVSDTRVHPDYDPGTLAHDLALLTLREPAPVAALELDPRTLDASLVGQTLRMVGFGMTAPTSGDAGDKRTGTAQITAIDADELTAVPAPSLPCRGDSGGPALLDDGTGERVGGVVSHGDAACTDNAVFARVDVARATFIAPYLAETAPGTAATGDACFYDGHCAEGTCRQAADDPLLSFCARPCRTEADCPAAMTCASGECAYPLPSPGALGSACAGDAVCTSDLCFLPGDGGEGTCTKSCLGAPDSCPAGFECKAIETFVNDCLPAPGGCGCGSAPSRRGHGAWVLLVGIFAALQLRRRKRRLRGRLR